VRKSITGPGCTIIVVDTSAHEQELRQQSINQRLKNGFQ